jgi:hypothetical protein
MGRNHLAHAAGDATNAVLAAAGYNFRRLLAWLAVFLRLWLAAFAGPETSDNLPPIALNRVLHGRLDQMTQIGDKTLLVRN